MIDRSWVYPLHKQQISTKYMFQDCHALLIRHSLVPKLVTRAQPPHPGIASLSHRAYAIYPCLASYGSYGKPSYLPIVCRCAKSSTSYCNRAPNLLPTPRGAHPSVVLPPTLPIPYRCLVFSSVGKNDFSVKMVGVSASFSGRSGPTK